MGRPARNSNLEQLTYILLTYILSPVLAFYSVRSLLRIALPWPALVVKLSRQTVEPAGKTIAARQDKSACITTLDKGAHHSVCSKKRVGWMALDITNRMSHLGCSQHTLPQQFTQVQGTN